MNDANARAGPPPDGDDVALRLAEPPDLAAIGDFLLPLGGPTFPQRFPGRAPGDFFRWKYLENPAGPALVGVAVAGGRPVSTVAAVPKRIQAGGEIVTAYELGDFLTDEKYRRRGLFTRLVELVCAEGARRGGALAYVRPNENSFPILVQRSRFTEPFRIEPRRHLALGRALAHKLRLPHAPLGGLDLVSGLLLSGPAPPGVTVESAGRFGRETDELWERVRRDYPVVLVRDSSYLNWRFVDCPTPYRSWILRRNGSAQGFLVALLSPSESAAYILELFAGRGDRESARCLLRSCFRDLLDEGVRILYTWTIATRAGSAGNDALRGACPFAAGPSLHLAVRILDAHSRAMRISPESTHLSLGDFDGT